MVLVAAGVACGPAGLDLLDVSHDAEAVKLLLEVSLVAVLFTDAAGVRWSVLRRDDALPLRLLGLGLPLTMVFGTIGAWLLLPGFTVWELALVAVILAPTDAALGQPAIADPRVPATVRQGLNVESGLNDGIALPFFVVLLATATGDTEGASAGEVFLLALGLSTAVGVAVGWLGARMLAWSTAHGWVSEEWRRVPALMFAAAGLRRHRVTRRQRLHHCLGRRSRVRRRLAPDRAARRGGDHRPAERDRTRRGAGQPARVPELLRVRRGSPRPGTVGHRLADRAVRAPQPDRGADGAGGRLPGRQPFPATYRALRRLVRSPRPGVDRLRPLAAPRRSPRRRNTGGRRRIHRGAQRRPAWGERGLGGPHLRAVARTRRRG